VLPLGVTNGFDVRTTRATQGAFRWRRRKHSKRVRRSPPHTPEEQILNCCGHAVEAHDLAIDHGVVRLHCVLEFLTQLRPVLNVWPLRDGSSQ